MRKHVLRTNDNSRRKNRKKLPTLGGYEPDPWLAEQQIHEIVATLNPTITQARPATRPMINLERARKIALPFSEQQLELRRLVFEWQASGPNLRSFFAQNPALKDWSMQGRMTLWPSDSGRGHLGWSSDTETRSQKEEALNQFMELISNPRWVLLGGPCRECGIFYIKNTKRQKAYCSRACGSKSTAKTTQRAKRKLESTRKIAIAQKEIDRIGAGGDWKQVVASRTGYELRWITRSVNNKSLRVPKSS